MYRFILVIYLFFKSAIIRNKSKRILTDNKERERGLAMDVHTHTHTHAHSRKKEK
jgi:hypothetical protein